MFSSLCISDLKRVINKDAMPEVWAAVSPNLFPAVFEPLQLATLRFQVKGTLQLLRMHFAELQEYLKEVFDLILFVLFILSKSLQLTSTLRRCVVLLRLTNRAI